jgi:flagellar hook assembly protein FlgD
MPAEFSLSRNFPNPFNPSTEAGYELPEASPVLIRVFSMLGRETSVLVDQTKQAGRYTVQWDGTDGHGNFVPSGIYFMHMQAGGYTMVRKMTYLR